MQALFGRDRGQRLGYLMRAIAPLGVALLMLPMLTFQPDAAAQSGTTNSFLILLDISGSMASPSAADPSMSKIDVAKEALSLAISDIADGAAQVGLRTFSGCGPSSTHLVTPVQAADDAHKQQLLSDLDAVSTGGSTDISSALIEAEFDLPNAGQRTVLLVSDGADNCSGDPCVTAAEMIARGVQLRVDTIGFQTAGTPAETQLQCIADATGGQSVSVADDDELFAAIDTVIGVDTGNKAVDLSGDLCTVCNEFGGDRDNDGLCDLWETDGIIIDNNPPWKIPGADPDVPDIYVEMDRISGSSVPFAELSTLVVPAFANQGIVLHLEDGGVDISAVPPTDEGWQVRDPWFENAKNNLGFGDFGMPAHEIAARRLVYRWALFNPDISFVDDSGETVNLGGQAELGGNDMSVLARSDGRATASTFMHELGHALGLLHGGPDDATNFKPNYFSNMNYAYSGRFDYSHGLHRTLDESRLVEAEGIGNPFSLVVGYRSAEGRWVEAPTAIMGAIDWNGDGDTDDTVAVNLNVGTQGGAGREFNVVDDAQGGFIDRDLPPGILVDHDDWSNLRFNFRCNPGFVSNLAARVIDEVGLGQDPAPQLDPTDCGSAQSFDTDNDGLIDTCAALPPQPAPAPTPTPEPALDYPFPTVLPPDDEGPFGFGRPAPSLAIPLPAVPVQTPQVQSEQASAIGSPPATEPLPILAISGLDSGSLSLLGFGVLGAGAGACGAIRCGVRRRRDERPEPQFTSKSYR